MAAGFEPERDDSLVFRFVRGHDIVDVLAPDNLGERARLTTVPPDSTMEALGSRQALTRGRTVTVDAGDGPFELPVPSLVGAIVIKALQFIDPDPTGMLQQIGAAHGDGPGSYTVVRP